MALRAVFFDLYETLVTHFDPAWAPPRSVAGRLGIGEEPYRRLWPPLDRAWQAGTIPCYEDALARLCAAAGTLADPAVLEDLAAEYRAAYARPFAAIEPEIVRMLADLERAGLKLGVVTNASDLDAAPWPGCRLAPFVDDVVASHRVGLLKPDPRIYALACRRLGVHPGEAAFVGDGGSDELRGAARTGLSAWWATWFLERWPEGRRPNGFPGDDWRQRPTGEASPYPCLARPADVLARVLAGR